jgi:hypothetical protein
LGFLVWKPTIWQPCWEHLMRVKFKFPYVPNLNPDKQGDQMCSWKYATPKMKPSPFFDKCRYYTLLQKTFWQFLWLSKQLPKENSHPIGENSPNLVTLHIIFPWFLWINE